MTESWVSLQPGGPAAGWSGARAAREGGAPITGPGPGASSAHGGGESSESTRSYR